MTASAPEPYSVPERAATVTPHEVVFGQRATQGCLSLAGALVVLRERVGRCRRARHLSSRPVTETLARPEGSGPALTTYEIPIEGRDEWLTAARLAT